MRCKAIRRIQPLVRGFVTRHRLKNRAKWALQELERRKRHKRASISQASVSRLDNFSAAFSAAAISAARIGCPTAWILTVQCTTSRAECSSHWQYPFEYSSGYAAASPRSACFNRTCASSSSTSSSRLE